MGTIACKKCGVEKKPDEFAKRDRSGSLRGSCRQCEREAINRNAQRRRQAPYGRYIGHVSNAKRRGIEFDMTFEEWLDIWMSSKKFEQRGRGMGKYCMCRYNDTGPYKVGNVFIGLSEENVRDGNIGKTVSKETRQRLSRANSGKLHPWSVGKNNPMHRQEVKDKISAATGGAKHYKARGVITPSGTFETAKAASIALGMKKETVDWRARHNKFGFSFAS